MPNKLDAVKIKQQRGRVLTNLNLFHPSPVKIDSLYRTLCDDPGYDRSRYQKDIVYFNQKGWVEFIDELIGGAAHFEDKVVRLTASGKEIAEGTMTDPALEI